MIQPFDIIVAVDDNYGIGRGGKLPWHIPSDLKYFKDITSRTASTGLKNAVIMGRKTWESIPERFRPLPNRINLVLTKNKEIKLPKDVLRASSFPEAFEILKDKTDSKRIENIFVIGGAQIFAEAMQGPQCRNIYMTHVRGRYDCDAFSRLLRTISHKHQPCLNNPKGIRNLSSSSTPASLAKIILLKKCLKSCILNTLIGRKENAFILVFCCSMSDVTA